MAGASETTPAALGPIRRVIMQPTGFCNINCSYCYLPDRSTASRMPLEVVEAVGELLAGSELLAGEVEFRWHAGEPLTVKPEFYESACAVLSGALGERAVVRHSLQTNGMLIDGQWCDLFEAVGMEVGVSIDGPAELHDAYRRTRRGLGTFDRTMAGIETLRSRGLDFDVISVITAGTLRNQEAFVEFIAELAPRALGINPEESEGEHDSGLFAVRYERRYRELLAALWELQQRTGIVVRRLAEMRRSILSSALPVRNDQVEPLILITVDVDGNMGTFSPELLGWRSPAHDDFQFGNVLAPDASLTEWGDGFRRLQREIAAGREMCRGECPYFALCGGGAAVNKWTENGSFASTETEACRSNIMAVADTVLAALERTGSAGSSHAAVGLH